MSITTALTIDKLETINLDNFEKYIVAVGYTITGTEGDNTYSLSVVDSVIDYDPNNLPSVNPDDLIAYSNITEQQIKDWIVSRPAYSSYVATVEQNNAFEANVESEVDEPALPWA